MSNNRQNITFASCLVLGVLAMSPAAEATVDFGKKGEPVKLVIGYQPYYTESWSGVVVNGKELWKKHLPAGSTAEFQVGLQGAIIVNAMTGEKQHIGYVGDMPGIVATFRNLPDRGATDIRIVAALGTSKQQCNIFLVRNDAPQFASGQEAVKWMAGKDTSSPHGSCTDRFARLAFKKAGIEPKSYLNQNIEVITTNFRAGKLDAAVIWEPTATKIVQSGLARRAASGEDFDALDGGLLIMLNDLIQQRPDVQRGWLEAELDAQLFLADLKNATEVSQMAEKQTEQIDRKVLWAALYGENSKSAGGGDVRVQLDFIVNERVQGLLDDATAFLNGLPNKPAAAPKIREGGVDDKMAREVLTARKLTSPVGVIKAQPLANFK
ncbi:MAG: nitrate ABC transporter substrate-binding protein [Hyphomicrobium sp.]|nr:nitrate ABC transporter substrate-binding protein [Hyphomicrobium sp.]PPC83853.1 MAG: nitrate ABC transporter substrate-binding protein [Hyphomicrobium sp.]